MKATPVVPALETDPETNQAKEFKLRSRTFSFLAFVSGLIICLSFGLVLFVPIVETAFSLDAARTPVPPGAMRIIPEQNPWIIVAYAALSPLIGIPLTIVYQAISEIFGLIIKEKTSFEKYLRSLWMVSVTLMFMASMMGYAYLEIEWNFWTVLRQACLIGALGVGSYLMVTAFAIEVYRLWKKRWVYGSNLSD